MAGIGIGSGSTPTSNHFPISSSNPDGGSGIGGSGGGSGGSSESSSTFQSLSSATPTNNILPPPSTTSAALTKPTVIVFNDAVNFGPDPANRVFNTSSESKNFSWKVGNDTTTPLTFGWYATLNSNGEPFDIRQATAIASAKFNDTKLPTELVNLSSSNATLSLTNSALNEWYMKQMVIKIDWKTGNGNLGFSQSGVFTVSDSNFDAETFGREATTSEQDTQGGEAVTSSSITAQPTSGPSNGNGIGGGSSSSSSSSSAGRGLSTGAKVGIAVPCAIVGILLIGGLVWFFLRRRRRRHFDKGYNAAGQTTNSFVGAKEVQPSVAESPITSPFFDDGPRTGSNNAMLPLQPTVAGAAGGRMAATRDVDSDRPETAESGNNNRSRNIAHLVEEGMTEADILRLEEEERHLDAEIERAAHGRTSS